LPPPGNPLGRRRAYLALSLGAVVMFYPFLWMFTASFKTLQEATTSSLQLFPAEWQWDNWRVAFNTAPFTRYFINSFAVAGSVALGNIVFGLMAAYAFARLRFPGRGALFACVLLTMMVPFEVALIPNFVLIGKLGWYNTYAALIVPWLASAFAIFLFRQALKSLPQDYFDAARVDGCGHLRFLAAIAAPLLRPVIVTVGLFAFLGSYNALLWPLVVTTDDQHRVVQTGLLSFLTDYGIRMNLLMCASTFIVLPTVALYFLAQRNFVESALGSGLKG
jgi:multiple sugar transport system permease protein